MKNWVRYYDPSLHDFRTSYIRFQKMYVQLRKLKKDVSLINISGIDIIPDILINDTSHNWKNKDSCLWIFIWLHHGIYKVDYRNRIVDGMNYHKRLNCVTQYVLCKYKTHNMQFRFKINDSKIMHIEFIGLYVTNHCDVKEYLLLIRKTLYRLKIQKDFWKYPLHNWLGWMIRMSIFLYKLL